MNSNFMEFRKLFTTLNSFESTANVTQKAKAKANVTEL